MASDGCEVWCWTRLLKNKSEEFLTWAQREIKGRESRGKAQGPQVIMAVNGSSQQERFTMQIDIITLRCLSLSEYYYFTNPSFCVFSLLLTQGVNTYERKSEIKKDPALISLSLYILKMSFPLQIDLDKKSSKKENINTPSYCFSLSFL